MATQTALITGAVACALGRAGGNVLVNYVTDELAAEMVAEEIRRFGVNALA
jgi:glucose 1-dehydrogenase